eukprot:EG_transcript_2243
MSEGSNAEATSTQAASVDASSPDALDRLFASPIRDEVAALADLRAALAPLPPADAAKRVCRAAFGSAGPVRRLCVLLCQTAPEVSTIVVAVFTELFDRRVSHQEISTLHIQNCIEFLVQLCGVKAVAEAQVLHMADELLKDVVAGGTISPPVGAAPMPRPWGCLLALLRQAQRCLPRGMVAELDGRIAERLGMEGMTWLLEALRAERRAQRAVLTAVAAALVVAMVGSAGFMSEPPPGCDPFPVLSTASHNTELLAPSTESSSSSNSASSVLMGSEPRVPTPPNFRTQSPRPEDPSGLQTDTFAKYVNRPPSPTRAQVQGSDSGGAGGREASWAAYHAQLEESQLLIADLQLENSHLRRTLRQKLEQEERWQGEKAELQQQLLAVSHSLQEEREKAQTLVQEISALRALNERLLEEIRGTDTLPPWCRGDPSLP